MKLEQPINKNYCATIFQVKSITTLAGCDNVVGIPVFGYQAIASKDTQVGDVGVVFTTETQLSDLYCKTNNLYRHSEKNLDKSQKGYLDDNRRLRAQKFRGHTSNALFMPLHSLFHFNAEGQSFEVGDEFDFLNEMEVCKKFVLWTPTPRGSGQQPKKSRVDQIHMPEHMSTDQFYKVSECMSPETNVVVTQKLHGTSIRVGHTFVERKLTLRDKLAKLIGAKVIELEHDYIFGSRKVIKDANNPDQVHYYENDVWSEEGRKLVGVLPENYLVYAELIGSLNSGQPIQSGYTYGFDTPQLYVYRIAIVNSDGQVTDLSYDQVAEFCDKNGLSVVPELWRGKLKDFKVEDFMDKRYSDLGYKCVDLKERDIVDEGVVLRVDGITPYFMKAKSPLFYEYETKDLDTGKVDLETSQE